MAVAAGGTHSMALLADGTVRCWGDNSQGGQIGTNVGLFTASPIAPTGTNITGVTAISARYYGSMVLKSDGTIWGWGDNSNSELGNGTSSSVTNSFPYPTQVTNMNNAVAIAAGLGHSLAVAADGKMWVWGYNEEGELGTGTTGDEYWVPIQLPGLSNMVSVAASWDVSLATDNAGNVFFWGYTGLSNNPLTPVNLGSLPRIKGIAQGYFH